MYDAGSTRFHNPAWRELNGRSMDVILARQTFRLQLMARERMKATGKALVGDDRLIVPGNLAHMYITLPPVQDQ